MGGEKAPQRRAKILRNCPKILSVASAPSPFLPRSPPPPPQATPGVGGVGEGGLERRPLFGLLLADFGAAAIGRLCSSYDRTLGGGLLGVSKLHWRAGGWGRGGAGVQPGISLHVTPHIPACRDISQRVVMCPGWHCASCCHLMSPRVLSAPVHLSLHKDQMGGNWRGGGAPPRTPPCAGGALHFGLVSPHFGAAVSPPGGEGGLCAPMGNAAPPAAKGCERQCQHWHRAVTDGGGTWLQPE